MQSIEAMLSMDEREDLRQSASRKRLASILLLIGGGAGGFISAFSYPRNCY